MNEYTSELMVYYEFIDGVGPWLWRTSDWKGYRWPKEDWPWHKAAIERHVPNRNRVVQAGGLQGMYPRLLSEMFDVVYTFEPDPISFFCLTHNCQKNNIVKMQAALGETNKLIDIEMVTDVNIGMSRIKDSGYIPMITIDSLNLDSCDLLYLDVEGYEIKVLQGAFETIKNFRPVLFLETNSKIPNTLTTFLNERGYKKVEEVCNDTIFTM